VRELVDDGATGEAAADAAVDAVDQVEGVVLRVVEAGDQRDEVVELELVDLTAAGVLGRRDEAE
jgi:hypothetical protein